MIANTLSSFLAYAALASASPLLRHRTVTALDEASFEEAQQRDDTATRAFSNVQIKTSDGRCLFVDELSGDFRANLTPIQLAACGSTDGQGWDVITAGKHINTANSMLVVSTLTNACFNFDPRRAAGNQVLLFSCGGRADGGGDVTNSQLFTFDGGAGPLSFQPENAAGSCFTVKGDVLDVANCDSGDANQSFTFGDAAADNSNANQTTTASVADATETATSTPEAAETTTSTTDAAAETTSDAETTVAAETTSATETTNAASLTSCAPPRTRTVTITMGGGSDVSGVVLNPGVPDTTTGVAETAATSAVASESPASTAAATTPEAVETANPTTAVPVSRAGGTLNPTAAAEANERDDTATRAFTSVEIRAPNGQCLFVDPTAGDFRQNLIPVALVDCGGTPNEKWDVITAGKHNDAAASALVVSSLTQGCISFDGRRAEGDTVTLFSCGGRADGGGATNSGQLFPFIGQLSFALAPESEANKTCIVPGDAGRLDSGPCPTNGAQLFSIFP